MQKSSKSIRVLVTAVNGDLGQALVKALRLSTKQIVCYGCDMNGAGIGDAFVDHFCVVPGATEAIYIETLDRLCNSLAVHAVIPGSEPEINVLSQLGRPPKLPSGIPVVCQEAGWIEVYGDKLASMQALLGKVDLVPFADGTDAGAVEDVIGRSGFPLVVKERQSSGSRSLRIVHNRQSLEATLAEVESPFVQAFIDDDGGEFSAGIFSDAGTIHTIAFRRKLGPVGCSWYAENSADDEVLLYVLNIARETLATGSINIQVRKSSEGVRLLEINPRFSSLVAVRAACGFRDAEWSLELALGSSSIEVPSSYRDIRFHRFFGEMVDFGNGFGRISEWDPQMMEGF